MFEEATSQVRQGRVHSIWNITVFRFSLIRKPEESKVEIDEKSLGTVEGVVMPEVI